MIDRKRLVYYIKALDFVLIALTLVFIWRNSAMSVTASSNLSNKVAAIVKDILPSGAAEDFVVKYIRKIAHFTEYGLLGIEVTVYLVLSDIKPAFMPLSILFSFIVGLFDECIQIFTGRGNSMKDVALDVAGYTFYAALTYAFFLVLILVSKKRKDSNDEQEKSA